MKRRNRFRPRLILWSVLIGGILGGGVYFFPREYPGMTFWEALYNTLRLFMLDPAQEEFPHSWPLILLFFAAPVAAVSALGTIITYLFRLSPMLRSRWFTDHVVICGVGRTGKLLASTLRCRGVCVLGIDRGPAEDFTDWVEEERVPVLFGDFHNISLLERAGAGRARAVIFASGDDLGNLEGAINAYEHFRGEDGPVRLLWVHIAHDKLAAVARQAVRTEGRLGIRFFDTYQIAAAKMIRKYFNREQRSGVREVNILGFGKFGRDLFEILIEDLSPEERISLQVVDKTDRQKEVMLLAAELGVADRVHFSRAAVQELDLVDAEDKAFFLCTDDDLGNLTGALLLAGRGKVNHIYVRMARWPLAAMADRLGEDRGVVFVNINELVKEGLEELPGLLCPAREEDLKRVKTRES